MPEFDYDINPVRRIIADAQGEPGDRTFFIQGSSGTELLSLVLEKEEVANLAISILSLLEELERKFPHLSPASSEGETLYPEHPFDPLFRIGQLILGYDEDEDMIWLIAKALVVTDSGTIKDPNDDDVPAARFVATRNQMRAMSEHALEVIARGRPICPLCNRSIDQEGHFCPRTDGHAYSILL
ncbi:DUF3090 domain-containing protein [Chloroflexi bacterium TSY]|nr:DUF3090 domain-containing protein [Chloroflexi bacterium TSY]